MSDKNLNSQRAIDMAVKPSGVGRPPKADSAATAQIIRKVTDFGAYVAARRREKTTRRA